MAEKVEKELGPPHSLHAEQAILGTLLHDNDAYYKVSDYLKPEHFFHPQHRKVFGVFASMITAGKLADDVTMREHLTDIENLDGYFVSIAKEAGTIVNAGQHGRLIYELALRRELMKLGGEMAETAKNADLDLTPLQQIEEIERKLYQLAENGKEEGSFVSFEVAVVEAVDMAARAYQRGGGLSGLPTDLIDVDGKMGGLQKSDLIILAGRPGMGKTALATNIAYNIAKAHLSNPESDKGGIVGFFSLEMSHEQLATRIVSEQTGISSSKIRRGDIDAGQYDRIEDKKRELLRLPLYIDQSGGLAVAQVVSRARRLKRQKGLDLMVVDYLQLMRGSGRKQNDNRVIEVAEITTGLKALAKELNIPILALSQLSRAVESRDDKRPQLSDLRESGSIEQDADVVMFVYREEYYHDMRKPQGGNDEKFAEWQTRHESIKGKAELIIGKQRHGPTGTVELQFDANVTRFADLHRAHI